VLFIKYEFLFILKLSLLRLPQFRLDAARDQRWRAPPPWNPDKKLLPEPNSTLIVMIRKRKMKAYQASKRDPSSSANIKRANTTNSRDRSAISPVHSEERRSGWNSLSARRRKIATSPPQHHAAGHDSERRRAGLRNSCHAKTKTLFGVRRAKGGRVACL
jgi:hypothetical protein